MNNRNQGHIKSLLRSLAVLMAFSVPACAASLPKMVLCITVDEMRLDYLEELKPILTHDGILRLFNDGRVYQDIQFPFYRPNRASSVAAIFTGVPPNQSGIMSPTIYNSIALKQEKVYRDNQVQGVFSRDDLSPRKLKTPTFTDYLKDENRWLTIVYSIAPYADAAIPGAGYLGDGAYWIDDAVGSWASSTYYPDMPWYVSSFNRSPDSPSTQLLNGQKRWTPIDSKIIGFLKSIGISASGFDYRYNNITVSQYKQSGLVNDDVSILAQKLISQAGYTNDKTIGVLSITFDASPYTYARTRGLNAEVADKYVRIDKDIADLLKSVDTKIGLKNCLITFQTTGYYTSLSAIKPKDTQLTFDTMRAEALINMYLGALYGKGNWVTMLRDGFLSLNTQLIDSKKLSRADIQAKVAVLLREVDGIDLVLTASQLDEPFALSSREELMKRSIYPQNNVDIYWALKKGYTTNDKNTNLNVNQQLVATPGVFVVMGAKETVNNLPFTVHTVGDIAKTIAWVLRIRPPNM